MSYTTGTTEWNKIDSHTAFTAKVTDALVLVHLMWLLSHRGDIVIAKSPSDPKMNICKRVIGLEGDKVCTSSPSDIFKSHTYVSMGKTACGESSPPKRTRLCRSAAVLHYLRCLCLLLLELALCLDRK